MATEPCDGVVSFVNDTKFFGFISFTLPVDEGGSAASAYFNLRCYRPAFAASPGKPAHPVKGEPVSFTRISDRSGRPVKSEKESYTADSVNSKKRTQGTIESVLGPDFGLIQPLAGGEHVFFHFRNVLGRGYFLPRKGESVEYDIEFDTLNDRQHACRVKRLDWRAMYNPIEGFSKFDNVDEKLHALADTAQAEPWDYSALKGEVDPDDEARDSRFPVLKNYIYYTFARAVEQDKISFSPDEQLACFNSGLVRDNWEPVFGVFERNQTAAIDGRAWRFRQWAVAFDPIARTIQPLPELVSYTDDFTKFIWDPHLPIHLSRPHITEDVENVKRWPSELQGDDRLMMRQSLLDAAEKRMRERLARNYKVAVPQCYKGKIQLLMPLCLIDVRRADLALVVDRQGNAYYGYTVLRLSWAYSNARLVCRPDSEWLNLGGAPNKKAPLTVGPS